ncbi:DUF1206 domain-containing protein [Agilicoccus flavus]|uniref:DUF1206 domain-containing protein n=1 Tax=Agilicoccus flavus TaxID=2775968 RepID=UPI001CF6DD45|nr:DUF1206 domain-containing protein [Agilicoccus flavus]
MDGHDVVEAARDTNDHPAIRAAARTGYVASGIIHLLIAYLAARVAFTPARADADQSTAMSTLADLPAGPVLLVVVAIGFAGLALWQLTEAIGGLHARGVDGVGSRVKAVAKAVVYVVLAWGSASFARGLGERGSTQSTEMTAQVMRWPGGWILIVLAGIVVVGVGVYHVYKGATTRFMADLVRDPGPLAVVAGRIGYVAKGIALVIVGVLMALAGIDGRAASSRGLSGALAWLEAQPFGPYLLTAVALGIGAYGVYSFFRARFTRV